MSSSSQSAIIMDILNKAILYDVKNYFPAERIIGCTENGFIWG
jgi:hypothetical protein